MDNLTHSLVGLAVAKAGLEKLSPGATIACVLAANAPDIDILTTLGGKWFYLHHHRGITHSIPGTLALALFIPILFYGLDRLWASIRKRPGRVRFFGLLIASLIASTTHPLMDWTNNYGVRPFLPWSGEWHYGDLVFIVDPWLWLLIGGACFLLTSKRTWQTILWSLLALGITVAVLVLNLESAGLLYPNLFRTLWIASIAALVLLRLTYLWEPVGGRIALMALALVVVYWGALGFLHRSAFSKAQRVAQNLSAARNETPGRVAAMPVLADPFHWLCVADTNQATYRFMLSVNGKDEPVGEVARFEKPQGAQILAVERARQDERARIFLDFARFPATRVSGDCLSELLVQFADIRYTEPGASRRGTFSLEVPVTCDAEMERSK